MLVVVENLLCMKKGASRGEATGPGVRQTGNPGGLEVGEAGPSALALAVSRKRGREVGETSHRFLEPRHGGETATLLGKQNFRFGRGHLAAISVIGQVVFRLSNDVPTTRILIRSGH